VDPLRTDELERDLPYWVALHRVNRLGAVRMGLLERGFPSMEEAWRADRGALLAAGLDARTAGALLRARGEIEPDAEVERLAAAGVRAIPRLHPDYPQRLAEIADPPPVLYARRVAARGCVERRRWWARAAPPPTAGRPPRSSLAASRGTA
jgi:predicted Rossmann fold nucleotide-binding protein DprA/Smf involved in DNA uptake